MTREEICKIVCDCIEAGGFAPPDWDERCEGTRIGELGLGDQGKRSLVMCIIETMGEQGCEAYIDESNFPDQATVGQACDAVNENHRCD